MERIFVTGPDVKSGQNTVDMPEIKLGAYMSTTNTIAACTGPDEGLTGIKRSKLHLSASFADDIDFIDTITDGDCFDVRGSITTATTITTATNALRNQNNKLNRCNKQNMQTSDQNANKMNASIRSRRNSKTSLTNINNPTATIVAPTTSTTTSTKPINYNSYTNTKDAFTRKIHNQQKREENANTTEMGTKTTPDKSAAFKVSMVNTTSAMQQLQNVDNDQNNKNTLNTNTTTTTTTKTDISTGVKGQTKELNTTKLNENQNKADMKCMQDTSTSPPTNDSINGLQLDDGIIAGVSNWKMASEYAYGISVSLYETNQLTKESTGNPIADCYGLVVRTDAALMALADGVNWGDGARLAARSAVHGCLDYLDRAIFGLTSEMTTTQEVFVSLLRSLWEGHGCILEVGGALSTLTVAVVLPLAADDSTSVVNSDKQQKYVVCACNVGDSLGYVYSKTHGVREFTQASHDITSMRDMRDALGALGPADGNKPELSNLTFSMTTLEHGDIVFLTSDGISDNFDPVVGKFAEAWTPDVKVMTKKVVPAHNILAPKRQNKSSSALYNNPPVPMPRTKKTNSNSAEITHSRPKYMRSHTVIESRRPSATVESRLLIQKSITGLPLVTAAQRHALTLYRLEDLLSYGINGTFSPCVSAQRLCHLLIDFVRMITSARRKTLEQRELFYKLANNADGVRREVELNRMQHRAARKRIIDSSAFGALPGKLDHATVVAYTVGGENNANVSQKNAHSRSVGIVAPLQSKEFQETNF